MQTNFRFRRGMSGVLLAAWIGMALAPVASLAAEKPAAEASAKVDLNRATQADLETLPGIGPSLAVRIVEYRQAHGPFQRIEDLMNVQGIGEKNFLKIRDRLVVSDRKGEKG